MLDYSLPAVRRFADAARQHRDVAAKLVGLSPKAAKSSAEAYHAIYVAGYALECALKAVYLSGVSASRHVGLIETKFVELGHNLLGCYDAARQETGRTMSKGLWQQLDAASRMWNVTMRYWPGKRRTVDAKDFLKIVDDVFEWAGVKAGPR